MPVTNSAILPQTGRQLVTTTLRTETFGNNDCLPYTETFGNKGNTSTSQSPGKHFRRLQLCPIETMATIHRSGKKQYTPQQAA